ncbi:MAG TPA: nucleotidyltransferase [Opitutaceae bacterium]|nr:nucleotidyltransferase [Opitutaceae bacterium]
MNALTPSSTPSSTRPIDTTLLRHFAAICEALDIPSSKFQLAKQRYESLARFLCDPANPLAKFKPVIYPQGSIRLQTAVKPSHGEEFDIDLICQLSGFPGWTAEAIFNEVKTAILRDPTYAKMAIIKNRCIRLTYTKDFYLDITPAVPDAQQGPENIRVTDRPTRTLKASNPKDYSELFAGVAALVPSIRSATTKTTAFEALIENRAGIEPVAQPKAMRPALNRFVQIFKRHRDVMYLENGKDAPISAIITTLAMHAYRALSQVEHSSLYDLLLAIAKALPSHLSPAGTLAGRPLYAVPNPANPEENYADKWQTKPQRQDEFFRWQNALVTYLEDLRLTAGKGADVLHSKLVAGFGEKLVSRITVENAQALKEAAANGKVGITSVGIIVPKAAATVAVRPQTFHN